MSGIDDLKQMTMFSAGDVYNLILSYAHSLGSNDDTLFEFIRKRLSAEDEGLCARSQETSENSEKDARSSASATTATTASTNDTRESSPDYNAQTP